jgi:protein disulfide-isomerase
LKKFTIFLFILSIIPFITINNIAKSNSPVWYTNLDKAAEIAKNQGKGILINFSGSDWCKWCKKLDAEVFSKNEFINYAKNNLILVNIDFPQYTPQSKEIREYNQQLAYLFRISGYPTVVVINKQQKVVAYTGYQDGGAANYVKYLKSVLK